MVTISFIIVTYFSHDLIQECIKSVNLFMCDYAGSYEIIIVDQSSEEGYHKLTQIIKNEIKDNFTVVHNTKNGGYGQGNNIGIRIAKGDYIVIMNPDVLLPASGISEVINEFYLQSKLALIGGKQSGGINLSFWVRPEYNFPIFTTFLCLLCNRLNFYKEKYMFLSGALFFIDKKKFNDIGLFDENIFLYFEESDVIRRLLKMGYTTAFLKNLKYKHLVDESKEFTDRNFEIEFTSARYYFKKYNANFAKFLDRKMFSYRIHVCFLYILNRKESLKKTLVNLRRINKLKEYDSN